MSRQLPVADFNTESWDEPQEFDFLILRPGRYIS